MAITHATPDDLIFAEGRVARLARELEDLHRKALAKLCERQQAEAEAREIREILGKQHGMTA